MKILDELLKRKYLKTGRDLGLILTYLYMGEPLGYKKLKTKYLKIEEKLSKKGFSPLSINNFAMVVGWNRGELNPITKCSIDEALFIHESNKTIIRDYENQIKINFSNKIVNS